MAKKRAPAKNNTSEYLYHTCGECCWGEFTFEFQNLNIDGKPICLDCPYTENRRRIRSERACDKWKPKKHK